MSPITIKCSPQDGPSRFERRVASRHIGTFEGDRSRNSHGYADPYSIPKALAALASLAIAILCTATIMGAL